MSMLQKRLEFSHMSIHHLLPQQASNSLAINMYEKFGYIRYRRVLGYYSGDDSEDAFDMRKALSRDVGKESVVPLNHPVRPEDLEW